MAEVKKGDSLTGMTEQEAQEFHGVFMTSFIVFTVVALIAHILAWNWRPWLPGEDGYASLIDDTRLAVDYLRSMVA